MHTYDLNEAAKITKVHKDTLRKMAFKKEVPATKIGRRWVFPAHLLDAWIENKCLSTDEKAPLIGGARFQSLATRLASQRKQKTEIKPKNSSTESASDCGDSTS